MIISGILQNSDNFKFIDLRINQMIQDDELILLSKLGIFKHKYPIFRYFKI